MDGRRLRVLYHPTYTERRCAYTLRDVARLSSVLLCAGWVSVEQGNCQQQDVIQGCSGGSTIGKWKHSRRWHLLGESEWITMYNEQGLESYLGNTQCRQVISIITHLSPKTLLQLPLYPNVDTEAEFNLRYGFIRLQFKNDVINSALVFRNMCSRAT